MPMLRPSALDQLLHAACTHNVRLDKPVNDELLHTLYDTVRYDLTAVDNMPTRFIFVKSTAVRERPIPYMSAGNQERIRRTPVAVIVTYDMRFYERLLKLFPHADARFWYVGDQAEINAAAPMSSPLQGGHLVLAIRVLGLDCGPMAGFDVDKVDETFFPDGQQKVNFIINIGYSDAKKLHPCNSRLLFEEVCKIL